MFSLQLMIMRVSSFTLSLLKLLTHPADRPTDRPSDPIRSGSVDITRYGKSTESVEITSSILISCIPFSQLPWFGKKNAILWAVCRMSEKW